MKNYIQDGKTIRITVGSGITAGNPVLVSSIAGVAKTDYDSSDGKAEVVTQGVVNLTVTGKAASADAAIALGDTVYYDSGEINVDATNGVKFGKTLGAVASGAATAIDVLLTQ